MENLLLGMMIGVAFMTIISIKIIINIKKNKKTILYITNILNKLKNFTHKINNYTITKNTRNLLM